jgi:hypothetical protein
LKNIICGLLLFLVSLELDAQAGMNIYGGISTMKSADANFTPENQIHSGYVAGLHARLNSDDLHFLFSGEYGTFDLIAKDKVNFDFKDDLKYFKFKPGLGLDFLHFKNAVGLRTKVQGVLLVLSKYDEEALQSSNLKSEYKKINDGSAGVATSLGVFIGPLTADIEYEHGLLNFVNGIKTSKLNFLSFTVGLKF